MVFATVCNHSMSVTWCPAQMKSGPSWGRLRCIGGPKCGRVWAVHSGQWWPHSGLWPRPQCGCSEGGACAGDGSSTGWWGSQTAPGCAPCGGGCSLRPCLRRCRASIPRTRAGCTCRSSCVAPPDRSRPRATAAHTRPGSSMVSSGLRWRSCACRRRTARVPGWRRRPKGPVPARGCIRRCRVSSSGELFQLTNRRTKELNW